MVFDRWLTVWKPHLAGRSEPRRLGGPDFSAAAGGTMTVAHGVLATVFAIGGPAPGGGPPPKGPIPLPASLASLAPAGVTCSFDAPCAFLQTSSDQGLHWTRRYVPTPDAYGGIFLYLAGDPGRKGRYAIGYVTRDSAGLRVVVTDDSGKSWTKPVAIPTTLAGPAAAAPPSEDVFARLIGGSIFKPWMDYGPTGVLGFMWRQRRDDLMQNVQLRSTPGNSFGPAFDVYAALSCDGGLTWLAPVKVNAEPSPAGPNSYDDLSWITLDKRYAHVVWGDRRLISKVQNGPMGIGGVQVFYGRVPFTTAAKGAACGRAG